MLTRGSKNLFVKTKKRMTSLQVALLFPEKYKTTPDPNIPEELEGIIFDRAPHLAGTRMLADAMRRGKRAEYTAK